MYNHNYLLREYRYFYHILNPAFGKAVYITKFLIFITYIIKIKNNVEIINKKIYINIIEKSNHTSQGEQNETL